jgi:hypothetical protein
MQIYLFIYFLYNREEIKNSMLDLDTHKKKKKKKKKKKDVWCTLEMWL